jgi:hypothetical protein
VRQIVQLWIATVANQSLFLGQLHNAAESIHRFGQVFWSLRVFLYHKSRITSLSRHIHVIENELVTSHVFLLIFASEALDEPSEQELDEVKILWFNFI